MSDLIRREDVLDFLQVVPIDLGYREIDDVEAFIKSLPAVDAVEVVRCRDCKYYDCADIHDAGYDEDWSECTAYNIGDIHPDDYCAWGQRREDGLYQSLKRGLEEAIAYENGEIKCRTETREGGDA